MEVIEEAGCGWISDDSVQSMVATIHRILTTSAEERRLMGIRGEAAVRRKYNWAVDGARLLQGVDLLDPRRARSFMAQ